MRVTLSRAWDLDFSGSRPARLLATGRRLSFLLSLLPSPSSSSSPAAGLPDRCPPAAICPGEAMSPRILKCLTAVDHPLGPDST